MPESTNKRKRGRPFGTTKPPEEVASIKFQVKLTPPEREKLRKLGNSKWIRQQINSADLDKLDS